MRLPPSLYPVFGLVQMIVEPQLLIRTLGLVVLEVLVPIYWLSDSLVENHHKQVFNAVFDRQLGATRPVAPLTETERTRLRELVDLHAPRLRKVQFTSLEDKLQEKYPNQEIPAPIKLLLWIFTPAPPGTPIWLKVPRRILNAPAKLIFPAAPKLLGAQNARAYAVQKIRPYLKKKGIKSWDEQAAIAYEHRWEFRSFGGVSYALGCVPILSWLLEFSSTVGAAMWAADMEKSGKIRLL
ncbi:hypothetical protein CVIRNUC_011074 [Coccomyxa viridis]|uniref:Uncharacterized protein n=1 Tax=Coccomyxa viridis TaxID=1274662 RepID=A0AAV1IMD0_9CHLO|nr:hypothetical protein CVIRNUC_011074 [Coccomyxa viridis]